MIKFIIFALLSFPVLAETSAEEAIILNQELQFLENAAKDIRIDPKVTETAEKELAPEELSLERAYFTDSEKDEIRTRAAAPKRRSF